MTEDRDEIVLKRLSPEERQVVRLWLEQRRNVCRHAIVKERERTVFLLRLRGFDHVADEIAHGKHTPDGEF